MQEEVGYLGYLLTKNGIIPQPKKVEAMERVLSPKIRKQLKKFLGMVYYYQDMWPNRGFVLGLLNDCSGKKKPNGWRSGLKLSKEPLKMPRPC